MQNNDENLNVTTAYTHVMKAYDYRLAQQDRMAERANKMVMVIALVFAALSYGGAQLLDILDPSIETTLWFRITAVIGLIAAFFLVLAFLAAMIQSRIKTIYIPGTQGLVKRIDDTAFLEAEHSRLVAALTKNVRSAIAANQSQQDVHVWWIKMLNWTPQAGFVLTAVFVAATYAQSIVVSSTREQGKLDTATAIITCTMEQAMPEKDEDQGSSNDSNDSTDDVIQDIIEPPEEVRGDDHSKPRVNTKMEFGEQS